MKPVFMFVLASMALFWWFSTSIIAQVPKTQKVIGEFQDSPEIAALRLQHQRKVDSLRKFYSNLDKVKNPVIPCPCGYINSFYFSLYREVWDCTSVDSLISKLGIKSIKVAQKGEVSNYMEFNRSGKMTHDYDKQQVQSIFYHANGSWAGQTLAKPFDFIEGSDLLTVFDTTRQYTLEGDSFPTREIIKWVSGTYLNRQNRYYNSHYKGKKWTDYPDVTQIRGKKKVLSKKFPTHYSPEKWYKILDRKVYNPNGLHSRVLRNEIFPEQAFTAPHHSPWHPPSPREPNNYQTFYRFDQNGLPVECINTATPDHPYTIDYSYF